MASHFRLATFNVHHGRTSGSLYSPKKMLAGIASLEADVLCLQEIDYYSLRTYFTDQPQLISEHFGYEYCMTRIRFFGAGVQCIGIFSRYPIISEKEINLPSGSQHQVRKALSTVIECDSHIFGLTTTHLHSQGSQTGPNKVAQEQLEHCLENLASEDVSLVAGDLNMDPEEVLPVADRFGYDAPHEYKTSPSKSPRRQIDWFLARGCSINEIKVSDHLVGDHRALISTVTLS
ncbi:MAG TPA: endonuclease/exonuclease/phosphatase family protein [Acidimicrobiia bacterium]|nr:endonuclease/exonuclease/phosphatase family protein [Acidimicrobiia bacterium]